MSEKHMTSFQYQQLAIKLGTTSSCLDITNAALGLTGEAGEVADLIKKHKFQGHELVISDVEKELGDVLWYVALMCETLGTSLDKVMKMNIDKIRNRYPNGFNYDSSINRRD